LELTAGKGSQQGQLGCEMQGKDVAALLLNTTVTESTTPELYDPALSLQQDSQEMVSCSGTLMM